MLGQTIPLAELNYFTKNPERAARMDNWSARIKQFQDDLTGMPEEDKMRLPGMSVVVIAYTPRARDGSEGDPLVTLSPLQKIICDTLKL